jgi:hypothetical protein
MITLQHTVNSVGCVLPTVVGMCYDLLTQLLATMVNSMHTISCIRSVCRDC